MSFLCLYSDNCDDIWDVDTRDADNEYCNNSETDTDDEFQVVEEQQETYNTNTTTFLGKIGVGTRKRSKRTESSSSVSAVLKEGLIVYTLIIPFS